LEPSAHQEVQFGCVVSLALDEAAGVRPFAAAELKRPLIEESGDRRLHRCPVRHVQAEADEWQGISVHRPAVRNRIGEPMSFWQSRDFEATRLGMYVQTLGDAAKVDCALRQFVVRNAYRTAAPRDLLAALQPLFPDAERKVRFRGAHF